MTINKKNDPQMNEILSTPPHDTELNQQTPQRPERRRSFTLRKRSAGSGVEVGTIATTALLS